MKNKLVTIAVLFALSGTAYSAMVVSDPMSYTYMATQVKDSAISLSNQAKMLVEKGKELANVLHLHGNTGKRQRHIPI
ncbi:hypothetical protein [Vibrio scophthalmi]|uniref:Uncharacterized protein n=1 Tax=Vibrio scophthalmi TaxID=45658 RepID=A0A1E3WIU1_9VIBR|nr:hypothetical protein [Vibrio scophthalmi]ODS09699.1 hypothetical protein VSF3289_03262 [Vibrio scophthalmi]